MKKVLEVEYPMITTFPGYAALFSILQTDPLSIDWLYANFVQTFAIQIINGVSDFPYAGCFFGDFDLRQKAHTHADFIFLHRECGPPLSVFEMPNELIFETYDSFVGFLKNMIQREMYVYAFVDAAKISKYQKPEQFNHEVLIYGFDDETQEIFFSDFPVSKSGKYSFTTCSYAEMETAWKKQQEIPFPSIKSTAIIKKSNSSRYRLHGQYIKEQLQSYMHPSYEQEDSFNDYVESTYQFADWKTKTYTGVHVYDYLESFLVNGAREGTLDHLPFFAMFDHKQFMLKRLLRMQELGLFNKNIDVFITQYNDIVQKMKLIVILVLKLKYSHDETAMEKIKNLISEVQVLEQAILQSICSHICQ